MWPIWIALIPWAFLICFIVIKILQAAHPLRIKEVIENIDVFVIYHQNEDDNDKSTYQIFDWSRFNELRIVGIEMFLPKEMMDRIVQKVRKEMKRLYGKNIEEEVIIELLTNGEPQIYPKSRIAVLRDGGYLWKPT